MLPVIVNTIFVLIFELTESKKELKKSENKSWHEASIRKTTQELVLTHQRIRYAHVLSGQTLA